MRPAADIAGGDPVTSGPDQSNTADDTSPQGPAALDKAIPLQTRLVTLDIKGSLPVARDALAERGIECMTTQELRFAIDAEVMTRAVVDGDRFGTEVAYWYTEESTAPFPPGTLLHYGCA
jgi:hypothetical protein